LNRCIRGISQSQLLVSAYRGSHLPIELCYRLNIENGRAQVQFAVGYKFEGKTGHVVVDAEDALIAALKVKMLP
jgi:hypothetical protein